MGHKTVQALPVQPEYCVVNHRSQTRRICKRNAYTHPLYGISGPKRHDFPLLIIRYMYHRPLNRTYEPSPLFEIRGRSTAHLSRELIDIHIILVVKVLDFVDSRFQFSIPEDGWGAAGCCCRHGRMSMGTWGAGASCGVIIQHPALPCADMRPPHFRHMGARYSARHIHCAEQSIGSRKCDESI